MKMIQNIVISWATWKFVNIDVIFLNKIIKFVTYHLHVWAASHQTRNVPLTFPEGYNEN